MTTYPNIAATICDKKARLLTVAISSWHSRVIYRHTRDSTRRRRDKKGVKSPEVDALQAPLQRKDAAENATVPAHDETFYFWLF